MYRDRHSLLTYWYFHLPNFVLAALMYTLLGRALLGLIVQPDSSNYIWRFFCRITDPVVAVVALVTPKAAAPVVVWLFGVVWLFWLRVGLLYRLPVPRRSRPAELSLAMDRNFYYVGIAFFGMINGLFNQACVAVLAHPCARFWRPPAVRQRAADADVLLADGLDRDHHPRRHPGRDLRADRRRQGRIRPRPRCGSGLPAPALLTLPAIGNFFAIGL